MALIHMISNTDYINGKVVEKTDFPLGAYCPIGHYNTEHEFFKRESSDGSIDPRPEIEFRTSRALVLYTTHHGLCIQDREINGSWDSDFLMLVWNPEKGEPEWMEFASTRGWTYPCYGSNVDATPETLAAYKAWQEAGIRRNKIMAKWHARQLARENREKCNLTLEQYKRLTKVYQSGIFEACLKLLGGKIRSEFKKSLAKQLRDWLSMDNPRFNTPFSPKQLSFIMPRDYASRYHY